MIDVANDSGAMAGRTRPEVRRFQPGTPDDLELWFALRAREFILEVEGHPPATVTTSRILSRPTVIKAFSDAGTPLPQALRGGVPWRPALRGYLANLAFVPQHVAAMNDLFGAHADYLDALTDEQGFVRELVRLAREWRQ